jgi:RecB family exonuclease
VTVDHLLTERDERVPVTKGPYLSFSRISRYLHCAEQYRLYYVENLRPRFPSAGLVFGQVLHQALAALFRSRTDPVKFFEEAWNEVRQIDLDYGQKESWERLRGLGLALLGRFLQDELPKVGAVKATERVFTLNVTSLDLPFVGVIDLVAELNGTLTVVDFKTSLSAYQEHEVILSDQLTAYRLAEPEAEQAALCVFVKTKEPKIEWHISGRNGERLTEFLDKAGYLAGEITAERFYKRPGKWCSWCDYLPVCLKDEKGIKETLVQIA